MAEKSEAALKEKIAGLESDKIRVDRISIFVNGGLSKEDAETKVDVFANLDDEQFKVVSDEIIKSVKPETSEADSDESDESDDGDGEDSADAVDLDKAEPEDDVDLSKAGETSDEDVDTLQVDLVKAMASALNVELDDSEIKDSLS